MIESVLTSLWALLSKLETKDIATLSVSFVALVVSAALQSVHEPNRKILFEAESLLTKDRRAHCSGLKFGTRRLPMPLQPRRMRKLLRCKRLVMIQFDGIPLQEKGLILWLTANYKT